MRLRLFVFIALILILSACTTATPTAQTTQAPASSSNTEEGYPAPAQPASGYDPGYPVPTQNLVLEPTPTQDPQLGSVSGKIMLNGKPLFFAKLFLADVLQDENGNEIATSLDRVNSPQTLTISDGTFTFVNVPAGRYGLMLFEGTNSYLLLNPKDGQAILTTVENGGNVDLGQFDFTDLPID